MQRLITSAILFVLITSVAYSQEESRKEFKESFARGLSREHWEVGIQEDSLVESRTRNRELRLQNGGAIITKAEYGSAEVKLDWAWAQNAENGGRPASDGLTVALRHSSKGKALMVCVYADEVCFDFRTETQSTVRSAKYAKGKKIGVNEWHRIRIVDKDGTITAYVYPTEDDEEQVKILSEKYDENDFPPGKILIQNLHRADSETHESFIKRLSIKY